MGGELSGPRLLVNIVARRLNLSHRMVRHLAQAGKLKAHKEGKLWVFDSETVEQERRRREYASD